MKKSGIIMIVLFLIMLTGCDTSFGSSAKIVGSDEVEIYTEEVYQFETNNKDNSAVLWTISDWEIASIEDGKLYAKGYGKLIISAVLESDSSTYSYKEIEIVSPSVKDIIIDGKHEMFINDEEDLTVSVVPSYIKEEVTYRTSNEDIISVEDGKVIAKQAGKAMVIVSCKGYEKTFEIEVFPIPIISDIIITGEDEVMEGSEITLSESLVPSTVRDEVIWESSNEDIATVKDGIVTAKSIGEVRIDVTCGSLTKSHNIKVVTLPLEVEVKDSLFVSEATEIEFNRSDVEIINASPDIIDINGNTILAINEGKATLQLSAKNNETINQTIEIDVVKENTGFSYDLTKEEEDKVEEILKDLTVEEMVGEMFILDFTGWFSSWSRPSIDNETGFPLISTTAGRVRLDEALGNVKAANFYINNVTSTTKDLLVKAINSFQDMAIENTNVGALLLTDYSYGNLISNGMNNPINPSAISATNNTDYSYLASSIIAQELNEYGINMIMSAYGDTYYRDFSQHVFSYDPHRASVFGYQMTKGYQDNNVLFNYALSANTGYVTLEDELDDLEKNQLFILKNSIANNASCITLSDTTITALDPDIYSCLSQKVNSYIRNDLNYNGLIMIDSSSISDISYNRAPVGSSYDFSSTVIDAIKAGCDMVSLPINCSRWIEGDYNSSVINSIVDTVELAKSDEDFLKLVQNSVRRILSLKVKNNLIEATRPSEDILNRDFSDNTSILNEISKQSLTAVNGASAIDKTKSTLVLSENYDTSETPNVSLSFADSFYKYFSSSRYSEFTHININAYTASDIMNYIENHDQIIISISWISDDKYIGRGASTMSFFDMIEEIEEMKKDVTFVILNNPHDSSYLPSDAKTIYTYGYYDPDFNTIMEFFDNEYETTAIYPF